ncbi:Ced-3p [Globodera pallida]|nr:Ced-3p [Globodera pallida]
MFSTSPRGGRRRRKSIFVLSFLARIFIHSKIALPLSLSHLSRSKFADILPKMSQKNAKVIKFFDYHSANFVDRLMPFIDTVRWHMAQLMINLPSALLKNEINNKRKCAIELVNSLREASIDDQLLMAFCYALLESGHCLELVCKMFREHLVDSQKLEQFARMHTEGITMEMISSLKLTIDLNANEENDENGDNKAKLTAEEKEGRRTQRRDFLQRHSEVLKLMLVETDKVALFLFQWGAICRRTWESVKNKSNSMLKVQNLIDVLLSDLSTFDYFCVTMLVTRQFRLFSIFHEHADIQQVQFLLQYFVGALQQHQQLTTNLNAIVYPLPKKAEDTKQIMPFPPIANLEDGIFFETPEGLLNDLNVMDMRDSAGKVNPDLISYYNEHKNDIYPNFALPRGLALVINNYRFVGGMQPREGTHTDQETIEKLLKQLKYKVLTRNDLTAKEMMWAIRHFSKEEAHQRADSAIVVVLSHGEHDTLLGTDELRVNLHQFVAELNSQNCPDLMGKPKIFVVQACRGDIKDPGVPRAVPVESDSTDGAASSRPSHNKKGPLSVFSRNNSPRNSLASLPLPFHLRNGECSSSASSQVKWIKEPTNADILIAQSTTAHYVSWRNSVRGTWFVQSLCKVFSRWAAHEDICQMLTRVHAEVSSIEGSTPERAKQVPEMNSTLRKRFFFFPGLERPI